MAHMGACRVPASCLTEVPYPRPPRVLQVCKLILTSGPSVIEIMPMLHYLEPLGNEGVAISALHKPASLGNLGNFELRTFSRAFSDKV